MNAKEAISRLCALQERVAEAVVGHESSHDCFCGQGGFWGSKGYDGTFEGGYRNDGACIAFIEQAVEEKIARLTVRESVGT
jgi:hypothetical protein